MEWPLNRLGRIEAGAVDISVHDLRPLLEFYELAPADVERLLNLAGGGGGEKPFSE